MLTKSTWQTDKKLFTLLLITLSVSFIFPEYIAPLFVFFLYIYFIIHFKKTGRNAKLGDLGKVFFAYTCYMVISGIWSNTHILSSLIGLLWMGCFLGYLMVANAVNTEEKLKNAFTAINISAGITGAIGIAEFVTYNLTKHTKWFNFIVANPLYYKFNDKIFDLFSFDVVNNVYPSRATSTFDNPLILATFLVMAAPFGIFGMIYFKEKVHRAISTICLLLTLGGLLCTESRGAYIAVALSVLMLLISNKKVFKKLIPFIIILAIALPAILFIRFKNSPPGDLFVSNQSRMNIWKAGFKIFTEHPIFGLGAGTENIHQIIISRLHVDRAHTHNLFLQIAAEGGIIGLAFAIAIIVVLIKNLKKLFKNEDSILKAYAFTYISAFVGFITMSVFEHTLQTPKEMMMFLFLLGFTEATVRLADNTVQLADDEKEEKEEITV
ncbi:MAG: O-antigen ligase family protein [Eubacterium sp.]|nr:O-antigen ligase family protein [Eubacterium sp.]